MGHIPLEISLLARIAHPNIVQVSMNATSYCVGVWNLDLRREGGGKIIGQPPPSHFSTENFLMQLLNV